MRQQQGDWFDRPMVQQPAMVGRMADLGRPQRPQGQPVSGSMPVPGRMPVQSTGAQPAPWEPAPVSTAQPVGGEVAMLAPNGQTKQVPRDQVEHYLSRGARRIP